MESALTLYQRRYIRVFVNDIQYVSQMAYLSDENFITLFVYKSFTSIEIFAIFTTITTFVDAFRMVILHNLSHTHN